MSRTVIIGPTGSRLRTVNLATGPSGATGTWATAHYAGSGPTGLFETVQIATARDNRFKSIAVLGFTGTVTPDAGGGGGSAPAWVPPNAKIHIDLINNRAWTQADGVVAIGTLLGNDPDATTGWGVTAYHSADLTADGLVYSSTTPPALIGEAKTKMLAGATIRFVVKHLDTSLGTPTGFPLVTLDGSNAIEIDFGGSPNHFVDAFTWNGTTATLNNVAHEGTIGDTNTLAATITSNRIEASLNGSTVLTNSDAHPAVAAVVIDTQPHQNQALQSVTLYDALPDTTGLPALST